MKTSRSLSAFFGLLAILVSSPAKAEYPLISSTSVPGAVSGSLVNRLVQNPATGDLYAAGSLAAGAGNLNIWVARYSPALVMLSSFTYDKAGFNDAALGVAVDTLTSDVYVTGYVSSGAAQSSRDAWLARFDSTLVLQSSITVDGSASDRDEGTSLSVSSGAVYVVGISSQPGGKGIWLANYAATFVLISSGNYYQNNCEVSDFLRTAGGTFVVGGRAPNFLVSNDAWIGKFDANHVFLASAAYNGPASQTDHLHALAEDGSGGVFAVGFVYSATMADQYIAHFDSSLVRTASTTVNGPNNNNDSLTSVVRTASGTLLVSGSYSAVAGLGGINLYLAEYDSALNKLSSTSYASSGSGADASYAVLVGANQDVYAAGYAANAGSQDMWLGRFSTNTVVAPSVPASLAATGVGLGAATLSWASGGNSTGTVYELERSTGTGFGLRQSSTAVSFVDAALSPASTYYYRVRALNAELAASAYTSTLAVVSLPIPVYPALASVAPSSAAAWTSLPAAVVGTGFDASAALSLERMTGSGVWTATGSFTTARFGSASIRLRDGRALLVGGQLEGSGAGRAEVDLFTLSSGTWSSASPLNVGRYEVPIVMLADGRVLVSGGQAPDASVGATTEIYDPATGAWTLVAPMTQARKAHRLALLPDGRVLAVGGASGPVTAVLTAEIYDPVLNTWTPAPSMSALRAFPTLTVLGNGKVLVAGGRDPTAKSASAQLYDPVANTWTETGPMSIGRSDHEAVLLPDGRVLLAGGLDTVGESASGDVYDPVTSSWTATGLMSAQRRCVALAVVNGEPLAIGGQSSLTDFASTDLYDAATNSWRAGPSLTGTRTLAAAVVLDDGKVLVAGGRRGLGGGTNLNTAERLDVPSASIAATGVSVPDAQHVNGTVILAGAATGYWDVVVRESGGRVGRLSGGVRVSTGVAPPASLAASGVGLGAATITWASGGNPGGTVYELERSTGTGFGLRLSSTALSFLDLTLSPGSTYYFRVRARDAQLVASDYSSTLAVVSLPSDVRPAIVSVTPSAAATGASFPAAVVGTGFEAPAALSLERLAVDQTTWSASGSFAQGRYYTTLTKLRDGRALLAGGILEGGTAGLAAVDLYDPATGAWTAGPALNVGRRLHAAVRLADGRVLVSGGVAPNSALTASAEIYDPALGAWTTIAPMGTVRMGHVMALLPDGRALSAGGYDGVNTLSSAEIYDPAANAWTAAPAMSAGRQDAAAAVLGNGKVLVTGGTHNTGTNSSADLYDPAGNSWAPAGVMGNGRFSHQAAVLPDGRVLVSGGGNGGVITATADVYDPGSGAWTATGALGAQRYAHAMVVVHGTPMIIGGTNIATDLASTELYDAAGNAWRPGPSLSGTRHWLRAAVLDNGKVLAAAGRRGLVGATNVNSAELLGGATVQIQATGVSVPDAQHVNGTVSLAGAATGYWDVVVRDPAGRVGRLSGGVLVALPVAAPSGFAGSALSTSSILWSWADNSPNETGYRVMAGAVNVSGDLAAGATTWLQAGLGVNAVSGTLFARGFNAGGSADSAPAARYSLAAVPENLAATVFLTSAAVAWTSGNPAGTFFALERSTGGVFSLTASTTAASWVDPGLGAGTTYYYRVRAFNADAVATAYGSSVAARTAVAAVPDAPSAFAGAAQSTTSILWSWTDNSADETGFRVKAGGTDLSGALPAGTTAWLQTGLGVNASAGAMFAQAFNSTGTADSASLARYSLAAAPFGLASSDVFQTSATVSWTAGNPAGTIFELERSSGFGFVSAASTASASYTDTGLSEASTYTYRVRALNGDSTATAYASSIAFTTRPMPPPAAPAGFAGAAQSPVSILWSWTDAASTEAGYRVLSGAVVLSSGLAAGTTAWLQDGLSTNTAYGPFAAQAFNPGGTVNSAAASRYTLAAAPTGGAVASITSTTMVASWSLAGNPPATIAALERSLDAVVYSTLAAGAVTSWADADLLGCTTYYYRVRNVNGDGVATAYVSFSGVTGNTIPGPPSGLSASANAGGTIGLAWGFSPTEGVTGYRLYWDAGSGTVSYAAPLAVLGSTASAFTTGVLTSSAAYTFALRAVHRCGVVETAGASAMSGAATAAAEVRAAIKEPDSGRRVNGNRVTILGELVAGTPGDVQQVVFQYKLAASTGWIDVDEANVNHPNPDFSFPYFVHVDVTALAAGDYDLRAVAYNRDGVPDPAPPAVRVVVDPVTPDVSETRLVDGTIKKDQTVSNAVTSVIDTAGAGAADPAVRVTIPVGAVNSTTATVSVIANPAITTAAPSGQTFVGSAIKIDLSNGQSALNGTAEITLTYPDTVLFPSLLQIYYLDEATGRWSRDFNSTVDTASRTVTGRTPHFSTFAIMLGTAFAPDLSSVRVYPVPFKPNGSNPDEGRPFSIGDANSGIIFANMASGAEIRIYTLTGRLVASLDSPSIAGTVRWDARNQDGRDVASGAYFAVISAAGQKNVVKKLVIIR